MWPFDYAWFVVRHVHLHEDRAWFDKLTMREMGGLQGAIFCKVSDWLCSPFISLMVSLSNHRQSPCNPSERVRA
ncbi:hypothetical protein FHW17_000369 [Phyllobacterium sp. P30BS-XVII]|nr:hypothetical protein [Phyllobacterium sp. P30BS-XVII]